MIVRAKPISKLLLLLVLGAFTLSCYSRVVAEDLPTIGFVIPLSGEWAFLGEGIRDGARLAQSDLKGEGQPVELRFEDNRGDLATSARLGSNLASSNRVDALVSIISGVGTVLKPLANRHKIIHVGICSEPQVADGVFSFINYLTAEQGVDTFLKYFQKEAVPLATLAVLSQNESGFQSIVATLKRAAGNKIALTSIDVFDRGTSDFRSLLLRISRKKPRALLLLGLSPEIEMVAKQSRELGLSMPLVSIESFGLAQDPTVFEGSWFVDSRVPEITFRERFKREFKREVTAGVGHAYATVRMLASSLTSSRNREDAARRFRLISSFPSVIGPLTVLPSGVIWSEASRKIIRSGKIELINEPLQ